MRLTEPMKHALLFWIDPHRGVVWLDHLSGKLVPTYEGLVRRKLTNRISDMDGTRYRLTDLGRAEREKLRSSK